MSEIYGIKIVSVNEGESYAVVGRESSQEFGQIYLSSRWDMWLFKEQDTGTILSWDCQELMQLGKFIARLEKGRKTK